MTTAMLFMLGSKIKPFENNLICTITWYGVQLIANLEKTKVHSALFIEFAIPPQSRLGGVKQESNSGTL